MTRLATLMALTLSASCAPAQLQTWAAVLDLDGIDVHNPESQALAAEAWCTNGAELAAIVGPEVLAAMPPGELPVCDPIAAAAAEFGVDEALLRRIIGCETEGDPDEDGDPSAVNPDSGAAGYGQHLPRYWPARAVAVGYPPDPDALDPVINARVTAWWLSVEGTAPWRASQRCWRQ